MASAVITWSGIGQASAYDWRITPSELCYFHSQSQGRCWYVRTALETLCTQIGGEWSASRAKENYWTLLESEFDSGSTSHLSVYLTPRDLTAWSQQLYRDDKCTKQLYSVWILPVNYKRIMNRHARGGQCCWTLYWRCKFCSPFIHTHSPMLELLLLYFSKKKKRFSMRSVLTIETVSTIWWITFISINIVGNQTS